MRKCQKKNCLKLLLFILSGVCIFPAFSQNDSLQLLQKSIPESTSQLPLLDADTLTQLPPLPPKRTLNALPYIMDDFMLIAGLNQSSLAYSIAHRDISYRGGIQVGFEAYTPISGKAFFHFGLMFAQRGFYLRQNSFNSTRLEIPLILAYELPELRQVDFRFLLGTQLSAQIAHSQVIDFNDTQNDRYFSNKFKPLDFGFTAGLSAEYRDFFLRARWYIGAVNLVKEDTATFAFLQFELGYFLFRKFRSIPTFEN